MKEFTWKRKLAKAALMFTTASVILLCHAGTALADEAQPNDAGSTAEVKYQEIGAEPGSAEILVPGNVYVDVETEEKPFTNDIPEYVRSTEYEVTYTKDDSGNYVKDGDKTDAAGEPVYKFEEGSKKERSEQVFLPDSGELITLTEEQQKREDGEKDQSGKVITPAAEKETDVYCNTQDGTYTEDVTVISKNAIQKAVDAALAEAAKNAGINEMVIRVGAGTYNGDISISAPTGTENQRTDWNDFVLKILAEDSFEMNGTSLEPGDLEWARPDLSENAEVKKAIEDGDDLSITQLASREEGLIKKDDAGNEIITAGSAGNANVNGNINIDGINVILAGLYYSLQSTIKAKNAIVDIYGTAKDDHITAIGAEGGKGTQINVYSGAGDDTITIRGDVPIYRVFSKGQEATPSATVRVVPDAITASSSLYVDAGAGDDVIELDTSVAYFTATASVSGGPAEGSDRLHLTGRVGSEIDDPETFTFRTKAEFDMETRDITLSYDPDDEAKVISFASMSEARSHAKYGKLFGKDAEGEYIDREVFHEIFGATPSDLPEKDPEEEWNVRIQTATASDADENTVYTIDTYTDELEGKAKEYITIDPATPSDMPAVWDYLNSSDRKEGIYLTADGEIAAIRPFTDYQINVTKLYDEARKAVILKNIFFDGKDGSLPISGFLSTVIVDAGLKPLTITGRVGYTAKDVLLSLGVAGLNVLIKAPQIVLESTAAITGNNVTLLAKTSDTNVSDWIEDKIGLRIIDDMSIMDFVSDVSVEAKKGSRIYSQGQTTVTAETDLTHGLIPYAAANTVAVKLGSSKLTLSGDIESAATVDIRSFVKIAIDVSNVLLSKAYIPVAVNVAISDAELLLNGTIRANGRLRAGSQSEVLVTTKAVTGKLPVAIAVTVVNSDAHTTLENAKIDSGKGKIELYAVAETKAETAAQNKFNIKKKDKNAKPGSTQTKSQDGKTTDPDVSKSNYETVRLYGVWIAVAVANQNAVVTIKGDTLLKSLAKNGILVRADAIQNMVTNSASADPTYKEASQSTIATRSEAGKRQKAEVEKETVGTFDKIINYFREKEAQAEDESYKAFWKRIGDAIAGGKEAFEKGGKTSDDAGESGGKSDNQFVGAFTVLVDGNHANVTVQNGTFEAQKTEFGSNADTKLKTAADASQVKPPKDQQKKDENVVTSAGIGIAVGVVNADSKIELQSGSFRGAALSDGTIAGNVVKAAAKTGFVSALSAAAGYNQGKYGVSGAVAVAVNDILTQANVYKNAAFDNTSSITTEAVSKININTNAAGAKPKKNKDGTVKNEVGVGAAVAVDVTNIETTSYIDKIQIPAEGIQEISISAENSGKHNVGVTAGSEGGMSITPAVGVLVTGAYVEAILGDPLSEIKKDDYWYRTLKDIVINARNRMERALAVDASAAGTDVGLGGAFAVSVINDTAKSSLRANSRSKQLKITSSNTSKMRARSTAGAKGAKKASGSTASPSTSGGSGSANDAGGSANGEGDGGSDPSPDQQTDNILDKAKNAAGGLNGKGAGKDTADKGKSDNRQKAETAEGRIEAAAAVVVCVQDLVSASEVIDGVTIVTFAGEETEDPKAAGDRIDLEAKNEGGADIFADASTARSEVGVGVAVAINVDDYHAKAQVGTGTVQTETLTIKASDKTAVKTETVSGVGAKDVGVAGSVAISTAKSVAEAVLKQAADPTADRICSLILEATSDHSIETTAASTIDKLTGRADKNKDAAKDANKNVKGPNEPKTVTFDHQTPSEVKTEKEVKPGDDGKYKLPDKVDVPNWEGCTFKGYYTAKSGGTKYYDNKGKLTSDAPGSIDDNADITLYAQWDDDRSDAQKKKDQKVTDDLNKKKQEEKEKEEEEKAEGDSRVGVGAAFSLTDSLAKSSALVSGRNVGTLTDDVPSAGTIRVNSETNHKAEAYAAAGTEGTSPKYAIDAAVALVITDTEAFAKILDAALYGEKLELSAATKGITNAGASGKAKGGTAAVGANVAVSIPSSKAEATFRGTAVLAKAAEIVSDADHMDTTSTVTSATGASASKYVKKYDPNAKDEDVKKTVDGLNNDDTSSIDKFAGKTDEVNPDNDTASKINGRINGGQNGKPASNALPVSTNILRTNDVKTEGTEKGTTLGDDIDKNVNEGNKEGGSENETPQTKAMHVQVAAAVSVLVANHKANTDVNGKILVNGGYISITSKSEQIFSSLATGAATGKDNSNDIAASVAVAIENNKAETTVNGTVKATPDEETMDDVSTVGAETGVHITADTQTNVNYSLDMGAQALAAAISGNDSDLTISGAVAVIVSNNRSVVTVKDGADISGINVVIKSADLSKFGLRAGGLSKAKDSSEGGAVGLGISFALVHDNTTIQTKIGNNVTIEAYSVLASSEKSAVELDLLTLVGHLLSTVITIDAKDPAKKGLINVNREPLDFEANLKPDAKGSWIDYIPKYIRALGNFQTQTNYYVEALAGNISGKGGKAAAAGSAGMLFYNVLTETSLGNGLKIVHPDYVIDKEEIAEKKAEELRKAKEEYDAAKAAAAEGSELKKELAAAETELTNKEAAWKKFVDDKKHTTAEGKAAYDAYKKAKEKRDELSTELAVHEYVIDAYDDGKRINKKYDNLFSVIISAADRSDARVITGSLNVSKAEAGVGVSIGVIRDASATLANVGNGAVIDALENFVLKAEAGNVEGKQKDYIVVTVAPSINQNESGDNTANIGGALNVVIFKGRKVDTGIGEEEIGVRAKLGDNSAVTAEENITIEAVDRSRLVNVLLDAVIGSAKLAAGGSISVIVSEKKTEAISGNGNRLTAKGTAGITVHAFTDEELYSVLGSVSAAKESSNAQIAGTIAVLVTGSVTTARIGAGTEGKAENGAIRVLAESNTKMMPLDLAFVAGKSTIGANGIVIVNIYKNYVNAIVEDGCILSAKTDILVQALADVYNITAAANLAGKAGTGTAISGVIVVTVGNTRTNAIVSAPQQSPEGEEIYIGSGKTLTGGGKATRLTAGDSIGVVADINTEQYIVSGDLFIGIGATDNFGASVLTAVLNQVINALVGNGVSMEAYAVPVAGSVLGGGSGILLPRESTRRHGIIVSATGDQKLLQIGVMANGGAGKNVKGGVNVVVNNNREKASAGSGTHTAGSDEESAQSGSSEGPHPGEILVNAKDRSKLLVSVDFLGIGTSTQGDGLVDTLVFNKNVEAVLAGENLARGGDVSVLADSSNDTYSFTNSVAGGKDALSGNVAVLVIRDTVKAGLLGNAAASCDVNVKAVSDNTVANMAVSLTANGGTGASGIVLVTYYQQNVLSQIGNGTDAVIVNAGHDVNVTADSKENIAVDAAGVSAGLNSQIGGTVDVLVNNITVQSFIHKNVTVQAAEKVAVQADDDYTVFGVVGTISAGGGTSLGISALVVVDINTIHAGAPENAVIRAKNVEINASSKRDLFVTSGTVSGGSTGVGIALSVLVSGSKLPQDAYNMLYGVKEDGTPRVDSFQKYVEEAFKAASPSQVGDHQPQISLDEVLAGDGQKLDSVKATASSYEAPGDVVEAKGDTDAYSRVPDDKLPDSSNYDADLTLTAAPLDRYKNSVTATVGNGVVITADEDISIEASERIYANVFTGAIGVGSTGIGTGLSAAVLFSNVNALAEAGSVLSAGGTIIIRATVGEKDPAVVHPTGAAEDPYADLMSGKSSLSKDKRMSGKSDRNGSMAAAMQKAYEAGFTAQDPHQNKILLVGAAIAAGGTGIAVNGGALVVLSTVRAVLAGRVEKAAELIIRTENRYASIFTGSGTIGAGAVGIGASVAVTYFGADIETSISGNTTVENTGAIRVESTGSANTASLAAGIAGGQIAVNAAVAVAVNKLKVLTYIGQGVHVKGDRTNISVETSYAVTMLVNTFGVAAGEVAVLPGVAVGVQELTAYTFIGNIPEDKADSGSWTDRPGIRGDGTGSIENAGNVAVISEMTGNVTAALAQLGGGLVAVNGSVIVAINRVKNRAMIANEDVNAGNITVAAILSGDLNAALGSVAFGGFAAGINVIVGKMNGVNEAVIDAGSHRIHADGDITVLAGTEATPSVVTVNAQSYLVTLGGASVGAGVVLAYNDAVNNALIKGTDSNGELVSGGTLRVEAYGYTAARAYAYSANVSGASLGAAVVYSTVTSHQLAAVDTKAAIRAGAVSILARQNTAEMENVYKSGWTLADVFNGDKFNPKAWGTGYTDTDFSIPTKDKTELAQAYLFYGSISVISAGVNVVIAKANATSEAILKGGNITSLTTILVENRAKSTAFAEAAPVGISLSGIKLTVQVAHAHADGTFRAKIETTGSRTDGNAGITAEAAGSDAILVRNEYEATSAASLKPVYGGAEASIVLVNVNVIMADVGTTAEAALTSNGAGDIVTPGGISVIDRGKVYANAAIIKETVSISGVAAASNVVIAKLIATQKAYVDGAHIEAGSLTVKSLYNVKETEDTGSTPTAEENAGAKVLIASSLVDIEAISVQPNVAIADSNSTAEAYVNAEAIRVTGDLNVMTLASSVAFADIETPAVEVSAAKIGVNVLKSNARGTYKAVLDVTGSGGLAAKNVNVLTAYTVDSDAITMPTGNIGGVRVSGVSVNVNSSRAETSGAAVSLVTGSGTFTIGGNMNVTARGKVTSDVTTRDSSVSISAVNVSAPITRAELNFTQRAGFSFDGTGTVKGILRVNSEAMGTTAAKAAAANVSVSLAEGAGYRADAVSHLKNAAVLSGTGSLTAGSAEITAKTTSDTLADLSRGLSVSVLSVAMILADAYSYNNTSAVLSGLMLVSGEDVKILSENNSTVRAIAQTGKSFSVAGGCTATLQARIGDADHRETSYAAVESGGIHAGGNILVQAANTGSVTAQLTSGLNLSAVSGNANNIPTFAYYDTKVLVNGSLSAGGSIELYARNMSTGTTRVDGTSVGVLVSADDKVPSNYADQIVTVTVGPAAVLTAENDILIHTDADVILSAVANANSGGIFAGGKLKARNTLKRSVAIDILSGAAIVSRNGSVTILADGGKNDNIYTLVTGNRNGFATVAKSMGAETVYRSNVTVNVQKGTEISAESGGVSIAAYVSVGRVENSANMNGGGFVAIMDSSADYDWNTDLNQKISAVVNIGKAGTGEKAKIHGDTVSIFAGIRNLRIESSSDVTVKGVGGNGKAYANIGFDALIQVNIADAEIRGRRDVSIVSSGKPQAGGEHIRAVANAVIKGFAGKVTAIARFTPTDQSMVPSQPKIETNIGSGTQITGANICVDSLDLQLNKTVSYDTHRGAIASKNVAAIDTVKGIGRTNIVNSSDVAFILTNANAKVTIDIDGSGEVTVNGPKGFVTSQKIEARKTIRFSDTTPVSGGKITIGANTSSDLDQVIFKVAPGISAFTVNNKSDYHLEFGMIRLQPETAPESAVVFRSYVVPKYHVTAETDHNAQILITNAGETDVTFSGLVNNEHGSLVLEWTAEDAEGKISGGSVYTVNGADTDSDLGAIVWVHELCIRNARNVGRSKADRFRAYLSLDQDGSVPETDITALGDAYLALALADIKVCRTKAEMEVPDTTPLWQSLELENIRAGGVVDVMLGKAVRIKYPADLASYSSTLTEELSYVDETIEPFSGFVFTDVSLEDLKAYISAEGSTAAYDLYELPDGCQFAVDKATGKLLYVITAAGRRFSAADCVTDETKHTIRFEALGWTFNYQTGILSLDDGTDFADISILIRKGENGETVVEGLNGTVHGFDDAVVAKVTTVTEGETVTRELVSQDIDESDQKFLADVQGLPEGYALYMVNVPQGYQAAAGDIRYAVIKKQGIFNEFAGVIALKVKETAKDAVTKYVFASDLGENSVLKPVEVTKDLIEAMGLSWDAYEELEGVLVYRNPYAGTNEAGCDVDPWLIFPRTNYYYLDASRAGKAENNGYYFPIETGLDAYGHEKTGPWDAEQTVATKSDFTISDGNGTVTIAVPGVKTTIESGYGTVHAANVPLRRGVAPTGENRTILSFTYMQDEGYRLSHGLNVYADGDRTEIRGFLDFSEEGNAALGENELTFTYSSDGNFALTDHYIVQKGDQTVKKTGEFSFHQGSGTQDPSKVTWKAPDGRLIRVSDDVCRDARGYFYTIVNGAWKLVSIGGGSDVTVNDRVPYTLETVAGDRKTVYLREFVRDGKILIAFSGGWLFDDSYPISWQVFYSADEPTVPQSMVRRDNATGELTWYRYDPQTGTWKPGSGLNAKYALQDVSFGGYELNHVDGREVLLDVADPEKPLHGNVAAETLTIDTDGDIGTAPYGGAIPSGGVFRYEAKNGAGDLYINRKTAAGAQKPLTMYLYNVGTDTNEARIHYGNGINRILGGIHAPGKNIVITEDGMEYGDYENGIRFAVSAGTLTVRREVVFLELIGDVTIDTIEGGIIDIAGEHGRIRALNKGGKAANIIGHRISVNMGDDIGEPDNYLYYYRVNKRNGAVFTSVRDEEEEGQHVFVRELPDPEPEPEPRHLPAKWVASDEVPDGQNEWIQRSFTEWQYQYDTGRSCIYAVDCWDFLEWKGRYYWYHFNHDTMMDYGWYVDENGNRFFLSLVHDNWFGHMLVGWQQIEGHWYYFLPDGTDDRGRMVTGWRYIGDRWYYFETREGIAGSPIGSLREDVTVPKDIMKGPGYARSVI